MVAAIHVHAAGTVTVTYRRGHVTDGGPPVGPDGVPFAVGGFDELPLQEAKGEAGGTVDNLDCLMAAFVRRAVTTQPGFMPVDGTKGLAARGIEPSRLFFVGNGITFDVAEPGTVFLGINDYYVGDNGGGFWVTVSAP
jgi:hypothetical protein